MWPFAYKQNFKTAYLTYFKYIGIVKNTLVTNIVQFYLIVPGTIEDNMKLINSKITEQEIIEVLDFVELNDYINSLPKGIKTDVGEAGKLMSGGE